MGTRRTDGTWKLDMEQVETMLREDLREKGGKARMKAEFSALQVAVYVMVGGGFLGAFAAEQPKDFYIDSRVGKRPYKVRDCYQAVAVLAIYAKLLKYTTETMPKMARFHNCGVW